MIRIASYIKGEWFTATDAGSLLVNPATEAPMAVASSTGLDVAGVLAYAREVGLPALRAMTFGQRAALVRTLAHALHAHREALLDLAQENGGNTRGDAKFDVDGAIGTLSAYADFGDALAKRVGDRRFLVDGDWIQLTRSPRFIGQHVWMSRPGVAVHINAFNFPAWGTFEKLGPAFLAGVPVITKPATATALLTFRMVEILADKLPPGTLQLIVGSTGDLLSRLGPQDHVAFTGSNATGTMLRGTPAALRNSVRFNVEADSLNAAVLGPDVGPGDDLWRTMVRNVATDMTQKTGQKCTAVRRVMVPAERIDDFGADLVDQLSNVVVGDPRTAGVTMGPVSSATQHRDVLAGIRTLAAEGQVLTGGGERAEGRNAPEGKGYYVSPTVIRMDAAAQQVHNLEVFGPCVSLLPYDGSAADAAALIGRGEGSLVSSAYSDDRAWIEAFTLDAAPHLGRLLLCSAKIADQATPPGMVLPSLVHGGPGRAGGGEELGGERGLLFYMQRSALQGDRVIVGKLFGSGE